MNSIVIGSGFGGMAAALRLKAKGNDVTLIATGHLVWKAIEAAKEVKKQNINVEVINIHTIKPLDNQIIINSVKKTGCLVTAEEHNHIGGLGESISGMLSKKHPTPQEFVAVNDTFGESGTPSQLMEKYGLNKETIIQKLKKVIKRKKENY